MSFTFHKIKSHIVKQLQMEFAMQQSGTAAPRGEFPFRSRESSLGLLFMGMTFSQPIIRLNN